MQQEKHNFTQCASKTSLRLRYYTIVGVTIEKRLDAPTAFGAAS